MSNTLLSNLKKSGDGRARRQDLSLGASRMKMSGPNTPAIVAMCAVWSCDLPPEPKSTGGSA